MDRSFKSLDNQAEILIQKYIPLVRGNVKEKSV